MKGRRKPCIAHLSAVVISARHLSLTHRHTLRSHNFVPSSNSVLMKFENTRECVCAHVSKANKSNLLLKGQLLLTPGGGAAGEGGFISSSARPHTIVTSAKDEVVPSSGGREVSQKLVSIFVLLLLQIL